MAFSLNKVYQVPRILCKVDRYSVTTNIVAATVLNTRGRGCKSRGNRSVDETFHSSPEDLSGAPPALLTSFASGDSRLLPRWHLTSFASVARVSGRIRRV